MKMFDTGSADIVHKCCVMFNIRTVSSLIVSRKQKFLTKFMNNRNSICGSISACITQSLRSLRSGDRRNRRLTGSMTVLTVFWPLVRLLRSVATAYKSRAWPWRLHIVFSIRRINISAMPAKKKQPRVPSKGAGFGVTVRIDRTGLTVETLGSVWYRRELNDLIWLHLYLVSASCLFVCCFFLLSLNDEIKLNILQVSTAAGWLRHKRN